jgi:diguanylate cyclase (GGDEF)-like protein
VQENQLAKKTVLVASDDEAVFDSVREALRGTVFSVAHVPDVDSVQEILASERPDALLLDLEHCSEDGDFDLVQLMGIFLTIPTVALLDKLEPTVAVDLARLGAQDVRVKSDVKTGWIAVAIECAISRAETARYDHLTGLPNRGLLFDRLDHAITQARRYENEIAVLFVDLDRFKFVNDTMGHEAGDVLLIEIAKRIRECLRESDTVARLGGDEFIAVVPHLDSDISAAKVAAKLVESLSEPMEISGNMVSVSPSIGISLYPTDGENGNDLIKFADVAMYQAKQSGGSGYQFYRPDLNTDALRRIGLGVALQRAIREEQLELHYQPQLDVQTGQVIGVEALVRWRHPERGLVPPDQFVPLAEELGLMVPMGDWILEEACCQLKKWQDMGIHGLRMAVNLSAYQFNRESLNEHVLKWVEKSGITAQDLELELTEGSVMRDPEATAKTLQALSDAGVCIAIDDFGTGYSSLSYLKRFAVHALKIDRSFISEVTSDPNDAAIVKTVIGLARHFDLRVVAEGVETYDQLAFLRENKCRYVQGYLIARPAPAEEIPAVLEGIAREFGVRRLVSGD